MKLGNLKPLSVDWHTLSEPCDHKHLSHDSHALCEATGIHACMDMSAARPLTEATYKEIASLIDGNFLQQKVRADVLNGIDLTAIENDTLRYVINSSEHETNRIKYQCSVKFDEWDDLAQDADLNNNEKARMLLWVGNIRLHCTCPSFLYHGYQYLLGSIDASIYPEPRAPQRQNPDQRGIVCKHLNRILRVLPFYSGQIASEFKRQYGTP